ncbi:hypothetical protein ACLOJK_017630 [Asimina triloba]
MRNDQACSSRQFDYGGEDDLRTFLLQFQREEEDESKISKAMDLNGGGYFHEMHSGMLSAAIEPPQEPDKQDAAPADCPQRPSLPQNQELRRGRPVDTPSSSSSLPRFNKDNRIRHAGSDAAARASPITLSTEEAIEIAAGRFIQILDPKEEHRSMLSRPLSSMLSQLPPDAMKSVELVLLLLFSAEKTDQRQLELALALLEQCRDQSSNVGNPVERLVYYFSEALQERIERKKQSLSSKQPMESSEIVVDDDEEAMLGQHPGLAALIRILPFYEVMQFTAAQVISEHVALATRIHLIDLGALNGMKWTVLMQGFAKRSRHPIKLLKISAVGTSREKVEEIGQHLQSFAKKLNLPFTFNAVVVSDRKDLREESFGVKAGEVVAIYAPLVLRKMLSRPDGLEKLMRLVRSLNPCVMTVTEIQASHNSTAFIKRFTEALFFFGTWFDCMSICMKDNDVCRMSVESQVFRRGIHRLIAAEETDSLIRHVRIDVWRSFFARFGFVEIDLGHQALHQAQLITDQFPCGSCCTAAMNGKGLTIGWKGTPLHFVVAWRLQR